MSRLTQARQVQYADQVRWAPVVTVLVAIAFFSSLIAAAPQPDAPVVLIYPPWVDERAIFETVVASQGRPLRFGPLPGMVVAFGDHVEFLRRAGALLAFDAGFAAALCTVPTQLVPQ